MNAFRIQYIVCFVKSCRIGQMDKEKKLPNCIGIIMDGNRRWAKAKGLPTLQGHNIGYKVFKDFLIWAKEAGVKNVVTYAFSLENWKRTPEEVSYLMILIRRIFLEETENFIKEQTSVRFIGDLSLFPADMQQLMKDLEEKTKSFSLMHVAFAVSYGGREEIVSAINACIQKGMNTVTEADISAHLYDATLPDPDVIIRTSGEMRLSGFLPWQTVYSELFFTKTLWPDFSKEEFLSILDKYDMRDRRLGK